MTQPATGPGDPQRARLAAVAAVIFPPGTGLPTPAEVGISTTQLERVLRAVPELAGPLCEALDRLSTDHPEVSLRALQQQAPAAFSMVMLVVASGYYMATEVRQAIGYHGQAAMPVDVHELPTYLEDGSLERVIARGALYRDVDNEGE